MRQQLYPTIKSILDNDEETTLLLADVGVFGFSDYIKKYPNRVHNIGILEQSAVSLAAGMSKVGITPFVHSFSAFIVERSLEQLKVDFGYQELNGNFIGMGSPYDFPQNGPTHECPADVMLLSSIPNMEILLPGNEKEFDTLIKHTYMDGHPTYSRINIDRHSRDFDVEFGKAIEVKKGTMATIICFGTTLDTVIEACKDFNVTILYYSTVKPFDSKTLMKNFHKTIISVEPFYGGSINYDISKDINEPHKVHNIGIPHQYILDYGKKEEVDIILGLDVKSIKKRISKIIFKDYF